jgi:hypothetical protein
MKLHVGDRLPGSGPPGQPGGYLVTEVLRETPWSNLYGARKILYNFDFASQRCRETEQAEWLDVLLRTYSSEVAEERDAAEDGRRRAAIDFEVRQVLASRASSAWPQPLDVLPAAADADQCDMPVVVLARPHGMALRDWLATGPPLVERLTLLAELLALIDTVHREGLLLNGLGPAAVVVDGEGWLSYLASDCVVATAPADGRRLEFFPPERYPVGFSPPECFEAGKTRDARADLYGWCGLALLAISGHDPEALAQAQGGAWFELQWAHAVRLQEALGSLSVDELWRAARAFEIEETAFAAAWPQGLLRIVERGLALDAGQRPTSVAELRRWLTRPPPPAPWAAATLPSPGGSAVRVYYEMPPAAPELEVVVTSATSLGQPLAQGPVTGWLSVVAGAEAALQVALREPVEAGKVSAPVPAPRLELQPASVREFAEARARLAELDAAEPPHVRLLFRALKPSFVAGALLGSSLPNLRRWASARLLEMVRREETTADIEPLLWPALDDNETTVRQQAADALLAIVTREAGREQAVVKLFETLAVQTPAEGSRALLTLERSGADAMTIQAARQALSAARPVVCSGCGTSLAQRDLHAHLAQVHGFIDQGGTLAPRAVALGQLWDRIFTTGDREAHNRLVQLLVPPGAPSADGPPPYVRALEAQLQRHADQILAARWQELPRLTRCLRSSETALPLLTRLLPSPHAAVREIIEEVLLAELTARLSSGSITAVEVRTQLDRLCAPDRLADKIRLGRLLPRAGVKAEAVAECLTQLEQERPVACPHCGLPVPRVDLETHLRQAHRIFQFRGQMRSLEETLAVLVDAVCSRRGDPLAWPTLQAIGREEHLASADQYLATALAQKLGGMPPAKLERALPATAERIAAVPGTTGLARALAAAPPSAWQVVAFDLALAIAQRLPAPLDGGLVEAIRPLVGERRLPAEVRMRTAAHLLRTTGPDGQAALDVLRTFVAGTGKVKAIDRLHELEDLAGKMPAIDSLCAELEDQVRMSCPRCGIELQRAEMRGHLWDEHRLVLDGRRVREPWRMVEDWLEDYRVEGEPAVLEQCRRLADQLDRQAGSVRLQRLMLQHGIEDARARKALLAEARRQVASLCPHCFALVPHLSEVALSPLECGPSWLECSGYRIEVTASGFVPWLEIETPRGLFYDAREPGKRLTRLGAALFLAGPLFLLAIMLALLPLPLPVPALILAALAGGGGLVLLGMILLAGNPVESPLDRVIDQAWTRLVPALLERGLSPQDQAFVAALAFHSAGHGDSEARAEALDESCVALDKATGSGAPAAYLGTAWNLLLQDFDDDVDVVPHLVSQLGHCFDGSRPLSFATGLLGPPEAQAWSHADLARTRALLCARAFDDGLELREFLDAASANASLADLLDVKTADALAHLRLLRLLEPSRPWHRLGDAQTVFEIAKEPDASQRILAKVPDLLLVVDGEPLMYVCARGILFHNGWIVEMPDVIEVIARTLFDEGGYHLVVGQQKFWFADDPAWAAESLEQWCRWFFKDFRPRLDAVVRAQAPAAARRLVARNGVPCPECRRSVLPVPGEMGLAGEESGGSRKQAAG